MTYTRSVRKAPSYFNVFPTVKICRESCSWTPYFNVILSFQRHQRWIRLIADVPCPAMSGYVASNELCAFRRVGCASSNGSAVEPGLKGGERKGQGQPCCGGGEVRLPQAVVRLRRAGDGVPNGNRDRSAGARDRGRRSEHVTTVIASVGRGDAEICSHRGVVVGQSVVASVAIGDGADGEPAHKSCSSSRMAAVFGVCGERARGPGCDLQTRSTLSSRHLRQQAAAQGASAGRHPSHIAHRSRCAVRFAMVLVTATHDGGRTCSAEQRGAAHMFP